MDAASFLIGFQQKLIGFLGVKLNQFLKARADKKVKAGAIQTTSPRKQQEMQRDEVFIPVPQQFQLNIYKLGLDRLINQSISHAPVLPRNRGLPH